jgi:hypothetical protein
LPKNFDFTTYKNISPPSVRAVFFLKLFISMGTFFIEMFALQLGIALLISFLFIFVIDSKVKILPGKSLIKLSEVNI